MIKEKMINELLNDDVDTVSMLVQQGEWEELFHWMRYARNYERLTFNDIKCIWGERFETEHAPTELTIHDIELMENAK
jgi:hypothetical protein